MTGDLTFSHASTPQELHAFSALNEAWISHFFTLEPTDRDQLGDPQRHYLQPGGLILLARQGERVVGCAALRPTGPGEFELSKMAVDEAARGQGTGRKLLAYTLGEARRLGARRLFLGSSSKLAAAVHLYEAHGFRHLEAARRPRLEYARADVFMELLLDGEDGRPVP